MELNEYLENNGFHRTADQPAQFYLPENAPGPEYKFGQVVYPNGDQFYVDVKNGRDKDGRCQHPVSVDPRAELVRFTDRLVPSELKGEKRDERVNGIVNSAIFSVIYHQWFRRRSENLAQGVMHNMKALSLIHGVDNRKLPTWVWTSAFHLLNCNPTLGMDSRDYFPLMSMLPVEYLRYMFEAARNYPDEIGRNFPMYDPRFTPNGKLVAPDGTIYDRDIRTYAGKRSGFRLEDCQCLEGFEIPPVAELHCICIPLISTLDAFTHGQVGYLVPVRIGSSCDGLVLPGGHSRGLTDPTALREFNEEVVKLLKQVLGPSGAGVAVPLNYIPGSGQGVYWKLGLIGDIERIFLDEKSQLPRRIRSLVFGLKINVGDGLNWRDLEGSIVKGEKDRIWHIAQIERNLEGDLELELPWFPGIEREIGGNHAIRQSAAGGIPLASTMKAALQCLQESEFFCDGRQANQFGPPRNSI